MPSFELRKLLSDSDMRLHLINRPVQSRLIDQILPVSPTRTWSNIIESLYASNGGPPTIAQVMAEGAKTPLGSRTGTNAVSVEVFQKGLQLPIMPKTYRLLMNPELSPEKAQARDIIYNDADNLRQAVLAMVDRERWDALFTGEITFDDDNTSVNVDYYLDPALTLDITTTAGQGWNNPGTAEILTNLNTALDMMTDRGVNISYMVMSRAILRFMLNDPKVREAILGSMLGTPRALLMSDIASYFQQEQWPTIAVYDDRYLRTEPDGTKSSHRFTPYDTILFVPETRPGEYVFGYTMEELSRSNYMATNQYITDGGIYTYAYTQHEPAAHYTKSVAIGAPSVPGINETLRMKVLDSGYTPPTPTIPENAGIYRP